MTIKELKDYADSVDLQGEIGDPGDVINRLLKMIFKLPDKSPSPGEGEAVADLNKIAYEKQTLETLMALVRCGWTQAANEILTYCSDNKVSPQFMDKIFEMLDENKKHQFVYGLFEEELKKAPAPPAAGEKMIVGDDMICPVSKEHCDDETCVTGSECNVSGNSLVVGATDLQDPLRIALEKWVQADSDFNNGYTNIDGKTTRVNISALSSKLNDATNELKRVARQVISQPPGNDEPTILCTADNCKEKSVGDYNGHGAFACEYHMRKWNDEFDEEYR